MSNLYGAVSVMEFIKKRKSRPLSALSSGSGRLIAEKKEHGVPHTCHVTGQALRRVRVRRRFVGSVSADQAAGRRVPRFGRKPSGTFPPYTASLGSCPGEASLPVRARESPDPRRPDQAPPSSALLPQL